LQAFHHYKLAWNVWLSNFCFIKPKRLRRYAYILALKDEVLRANR